MKTNYFLIFVLLIVSGACKRGSLCDRSEKDEYYDIPAATKPYILNKKGEVLVFANSKNDTVEFLCTEESHDYKLVYNEDEGSADCPIIVKKYVESFEFNYFGDSLIFKYLILNYEKNLNHLTGLEIQFSDSVYDEHIYENIIDKKTKEDSILYFGQYIHGNYLYYQKVLFNSNLGIIKFFDKQNEPWQLIQKK